MEKKQQIDAQNHTKNKSKKLRATTYAIAILDKLNHELFCILVAPIIFSSTVDQSKPATFYKIITL